MAYDAGMMAAAIEQIRKASLGARIEKVCQPEKDEIVLQMRSFEGGKRLIINAGSNNPRMCFTAVQKENPAAPPMFCMLLRKHLSGAKLTAIEQEGFERVARLEFETRDEMGFLCRRYLMAEIMGKYSNLVFTDEKRKVLAVLRPVDFSTSSVRQVLPGMTYELPPKQEKTDLLQLSKDTFLSLLQKEPPEKPAHKWVLASVGGISAAVAREIVFRATGKVDSLLCECPPEEMWNQVARMADIVRNRNFEPTLYMDGERPVEYAFTPLTQYGDSYTVRRGGVDEILDLFFATRDRDVRIRQHAADVLHILTAAEARLHKKLDIQRGELADCLHGAEYKRAGDLITANLHALSRGMTEAALTDYEDYHEADGSYGTCTVALDSRMTPAQNAQAYYKKYNKSKNAKEELTKQISQGETELTYLYSVFDALTHAETDADLGEIRDELYRSGYASRMKQYRAHKEKVPSIAQFRTIHGYRVLCGKNNVQNEYITHRLAEKNDYWFHAKGVPGSHVVLVCQGEEPGEEDFTQAAEIAAYYSKAVGGVHVPVDYTLARNVKKVAGGKPGFVIYHTNWTAYVTPESEKIAAMRVRDKLHP